MAVGIIGAGIIAGVAVEVDTETTKERKMSGEMPSQHFTAFIIKS
jgi:hypothetical protein